MEPDLPPFAVDRPEHGKRLIRPYGSGGTPKYCAGGWQNRKSLRYRCLVWQNRSAHVQAASGSRHFFSAWTLKETHYHASCDRTPEPRPPMDERFRGPARLRRFFRRAGACGGAELFAGATQRPDRAAYHRRYATDDTLLPWAGVAAGPPHVLGAEMLPHGRYR